MTVVAVPNAGVTVNTASPESFPEAVAAEGRPSTIGADGETSNRTPKPISTGAEKADAVPPVKDSLPSGDIAKSTAGVTVGVFVRDAEN